ncbi:MAG: LemA family protein [Fretibacterium sp.]|nr:LemA family protein [Fretibacterium sp.]
MERFFFAVFLVSTFLLALVFSVRAYNGLVRLRDFCDEARNGVLRTVRRRRAAVSRLLEGVAGLPGKEVLLTSLKMSCAQNVGEWKVGDLASAEAALSDELSSFWTCALENCGPGEHDEWTCIRGHLSALGADAEMARDYYNATARDYNTRLRQFPSNLIGRMFRFGEAEYFESD